MHRKEKVLAPMFQNELGVRCFTSNEFNTDLFGTFSGEIERKDSALATLRKKCLKAMDFVGCDLAIASEGSFGAHPSSPFLPANEEMVIFIDRKNNLEILGRVVTLETNFGKEEVTIWKELAEFAQRARFPSHALILRPSEINSTEIIKGISDYKTLKYSFQNLLEKGSPVLAETDMRALYNPSRMKVIKKAGQNLIENIRSLCPKCKSPGFVVSFVTPGLPCELCGMASRSVLSFTYICKSCSFKSEKKFPHGRQYEDPMYCDKCNP